MSLAVIDPSQPGPETETYNNVFDYLLEGKERNKTALLLLDGEKTFGDVILAANAVASYLLRGGAQKGDRVLLLGENSFFWAVSYLGILRAGLVCVPLPTTTSPDVLAYIVKITGARLTFADVKAAMKIGLAVSIPIIADDLLQGQRNRDSQIATLAEIIHNSSQDYPMPQISGDDLAALMFTSGTTGNPRGVMVSHQNIIANTHSIIEYLSLTSRDRMMTVLPFHYCFGASLLHTHLRAGGSLVIDPRFMFPDKVLGRMWETECTGFAGVPSHYQILLRKSALREYSFPHLRYVQQAGGHLAPAFIHELREALPKTEIFIMYGQTEATARLSCMPPDMLERKTGSIGKGIPGVTLRVMQEGREVSPGEVGEIVAQGLNITQGYWRAEEETAASFRNGMLYTGDLATVDEDGYIFIVDRVKDFIKCGGTRVSCRQVEEKMLEFSGILEAAVIGIPDELLGEAIRAFIVPRQPGDFEVQAELVEFCKRNMPSVFTPKDIVVLESLPKNTSGKVSRKALREGVYS